jgi:general secretion pathway protein A
MDMYGNYFGLTELPFNVSPDPRFFYANPVYREALATLHYGIEARKGFVIITGEAGTGKTTLLRMLMHNLDSAIHTAFIFNPRLSFTALLRFILTDLGIENPAKDRLKLMEQLNAFLIEQLGKGHIVAFLVDEAQALNDEILEELRLLSNLETDRAKLIQIVLMGQPELESKLDQPELRQLKQRVALRCRLLPLGQHEVGLYIDSRLKTAGYGGKELFVPEAVEKITRYSNGIPRLVNVICDNALVIACAASKKYVSAEMIEEAARDLKLTGQAQVKAGAASTDFKYPQDFQEVFQPRQAKMDAKDEPWRSDFEPNSGDMHNRSRSSRRFAALGIGVLLGMAILVAAGTILYTQQTGLLAALDVDLRNFASIKDLVGLQEKNPEPIRPRPAPSELSTEVLKETPTFKSPDPQASESRESAPPTTEPTQNIGTLPETKKPNETAVPEATTSSPTTRSKEIPPGPTKTVTKDPPARTLEPVPTSEQLEFEIYKAIYNRAIRGVEVSVKDGIVYLGGRVATEKQKLAAGQAALGVPGIKGIRDQIIVDSLYEPQSDSSRQ